MHKFIFLDVDGHLEPTAEWSYNQLMSIFQVCFQMPLDHRIMHLEFQCWEIFCIILTVQNHRLIGGRQTTHPGLRKLAIICFRSITQSSFRSIYMYTGMQIHIRPVARGDKNFVRAIVNQHVTSPAGD